MQKTTKFLIVLSIFTLITTVILVSCPPVEEPKNAEITSVELISTGGKIFSLGNNSLLNVKAIAEVENEKEDTEIVFEWQLLRDDDINITSVISTSYNTARVDIDKLNTLGDYTLKCFTYLKSDEKNIKENDFVFTVNTDESLKSSLNYSFSNGENIDLDLSENGATLNKINKEWTFDRKTITSKNDRPTLSGTIPFEIGNDDVLILSFKDNNIISKFGELSIDTDETDTNYIYVNGYLLYFPNQMGEEETEKEVNLKIKAGSKQEITIPIKMTKASTESINLPNISVFSPYGKSGGRITITGDKVSTTYRPIEDGYKLNTTIYRTYRIVKGNNDLLNDMITISQTKVLNESDYKTNEDFCYYIEKENGIEYYFPYAGTYYVEANLITPLGNTEKVHYSFVIEPQTLDSSTYTKNEALAVDYFNLLNTSKYTNKSEDKYIDKNDIQDRVNVKATKSDDKTLFYVLSFNSNTPSYYEGDCESFEFKEEEVKTNINYSYKMAGRYTFYFHTYDNGNGVGNIPHDREELEYYLDKNNYGTRNSFIIENLHEDEEDFSKWLTITNRKINDDNTTTYTFSADDYLINKYETLYIGLFYGNSMDKMIINESNKVFQITRPSKVGYTQISIIYENKKVLSMTHSVINYTQSLVNIRVVNLSDGEQDRYNERKFRLSLTGVSSGDKVYYRLNGQTAWTSYTSEQNIYGRQEQSPIDIKIIPNGKTESEAIFIKDSFKINNAPIPELYEYSIAGQDKYNKKKYYYYYPTLMSITGRTTRVLSTIKTTSGIDNIQTSKYFYSYRDTTVFYANSLSGYLTVQTQRYGYTTMLTNLYTTMEKATKPGITQYWYGDAKHGRWIGIHNHDTKKHIKITAKVYALYQPSGKPMYYEKAPDDDEHIENFTPLKGTTILPASSGCPQNRDDTTRYKTLISLWWKGAAFKFLNHGNNGRYATIKIEMYAEQPGKLSTYYTTYVKDSGEYPNFYPFTNNNYHYPDVDFGVIDGKTNY